MYIIRSMNGVTNSPVEKGMTPDIQFAIDEALHKALPKELDKAIEAALLPALEAALPDAINQAVDDALTPSNIFSKIKVRDILDKILKIIGQNDLIMNTFGEIVSLAAHPSDILGLGETLVDDLTPEKIRDLIDTGTQSLKQGLELAGRGDLATEYLGEGGIAATILNLLIPSNKLLYKLVLYVSGILLVPQLYLFYSYTQIKSQVGNSTVLAPILSALSSANFIIIAAIGINSLILLYLIRTKENYSRQIVTYFWHFNILFTLTMYTFNKAVNTAITKIIKDPAKVFQVNNPALIDTFKSTTSINGIVMIIILLIALVTWTFVGALDLFLLVFRTLLHTFLF